MRFADHPPLLQPQEGLEICHLDPREGFEKFTVAVHEIIARAGREAFYVFDSLSELQVVWSADLMMGNFFVVTCPYLFELDTVAYFAVLRGRHSYETIARIRETTQLLLEVYSGEGEVYLHPLKAWMRYSGSMFLPHRFDWGSEDFIPLTDGVSVSRFYTALEREEQTHSDQNLDSWERFFLFAKMRVESGERGEALCGEMRERLMGRGNRVCELIARNFEAEDYLTVKNRLIGSGRIGGKACGMLLARKIVHNQLPRLNRKMEAHDSFYIGSDVFYTYVVQNGWWKLSLRQKSEEEYFTAARELHEALLTGVFPDAVRERFRRMLEYYGQSPIIVRSSSLLEDDFGNAFAGKYESVFCVNNGGPEERLAAFESAVRQVYASMMDDSALEYRRRRGLNARDEQMAILVQRVSGSVFEGVFMPCAAGVGYSYNSYRWNRAIDPTAGMLRLVIGLGTRAVDRTDGDYPRIVSLDRPEITPLTGVSQLHEYSQHKVDVLDLTAGRLTSLRLDQLLPKLPGWYRNMMLDHDDEIERMMRERGEDREVFYTSCRGLVAQEGFTGAFLQILAVLQRQYDYPVDIEFTVNFNESGRWMFNLLQCRPLQVAGLAAQVELPALTPEDTLFALQGSTMGAVNRRIDVVVSIDPKGYYHYPYRRKGAVARLVGEIGRHYGGQGKSLLLLTPGRIGTSSPELGVPVTFAQISEFTALCEVSSSEAGYQPELSFGSHIFQDLVEAEIFYAAILEGESTLAFQPRILDGRPNLLPGICSGCGDMADFIAVYELADRPLWLAADVVSGRAVCGFVKEQEEL